ncbi:MAG: hypothetical protein ACOH5I_20055 [Oligoflexus sp.]
MKFFRVPFLMPLGLLAGISTPLHAEVQYQQKPKSIEQLGNVAVVNEKLEKIRVGFDFALRFQSLEHKNNGMKAVGADFQPDTADDVALSKLKPGFTNAVGNFNLTFNLASGVSSYVEAYLSSEHHLEMWMREGYLFIDHFEGTSFEGLNAMMEYLSFKIGQMEINYGDAHFRRTDNGEAFRNAFIGNYIIDPNTTEIAIETMLDVKDFEWMLGVSGGTTKGDNKDGHGIALYSKLAYDTQVTESSRFRLSGSYYQVDHSDNGPSAYPSFDGTKNYLYAGNRSGSPYAFLFDVSTDAGQILPNASQDLSAYMINALFQWQGTEVFLNYDMVRDADPDGSNSPAENEEAWDQRAIDIKQMLNSNTYLALRYNEAHHLKAAGQNSDELVTRQQVALGHYLTDSSVLKLEYVKQEYKNFASVGDLRSGGEFSGFIMEGAVHF